MTPFLAEAILLLSPLAIIILRPEIIIMTTEATPTIQLNIETTALTTLLGSTLLFGVVPQSPPLPRVLHTVAFGESADAKAGDTTVNPILKSGSAIIANFIANRIRFMRFPLTLTSVYQPRPR